MTLTWTQFLKHIDFGLKNHEKYTILDFRDLVEQVRTTLDKMPDVLPNGLFTGDRKIKLTNKLMNLEFILIEKESKQN
jgi:hypothetical protein